MYVPEESLLEQWVSRERLTRYRDARECTTDLYLWNAELAAAYFEVIGHAEVLLRNVFHTRLAPHSPQGCWYDDPSYPFAPQAKRDIRTAIVRATKDHQPERPGKVVAELSFGFWRFLLGNRYKTTLWPIVAPGFTGVLRHERDRGQLEQAAAQVNGLRNRVAHHEPVFHYSPEGHLADIYLIARYVDDRAEQMLRDISRVPQVMRRRPSI